MEQKLIYFIRHVSSILRFALLGFTVKPFRTSSWGTLIGKKKSTNLDHTSSGRQREKAPEDPCLQTTGMNGHRKIVLDVTISWLAIYRGCDCKTHSHCNTACFVTSSIQMFQKHAAGMHINKTSDVWS